jgi:pyruvate carboxylase
MQGKLAQILVYEGQEITQNQPLFVLEAMKMETTIIAPKAGKVSAIILAVGSLVEHDDAVLVVN